jgi:hypothetical protein
MAIPQLKVLFEQTFGEHTMSNNGKWLRRKLSLPAAARNGKCPEARQRAQSAATSAHLSSDSGSDQTQAQQPQELHFGDASAAATTSEGGAAATFPPLAQVRAAAGRSPAPRQAS